MSRMQNGCVKHPSSIRRTRFWSGDCGVRWTGHSAPERFARCNDFSEEYSLRGNAQLSGSSQLKTFRKWQHTTAIAALATMAMAPIALHAAQLSGDARASIPRDVQQIIVVDYRQMQNSPAAMQLKDRVLPPELKHLETALKNSGLQVDQDADTLAFAAFRTSGGNTSGGEGTGTRILGVAQGQFNTQAILAKFAKEKTKATMLRNNSIYPMGSGGMSVAFL